MQSVLRHQIERLPDQQVKAARLSAWLRRGPFLRLAEALILGKRWDFLLEDRPDRTLAAFDQQRLQRLDHHPLRLIRLCQRRQSQPPGNGRIKTNRIGQRLLIAPAEERRRVKYAHFLKDAQSYVKIDIGFRRARHSLFQRQIKGAELNRGSVPDARLHRLHRRIRANLWVRIEAAK